MASRTDRYGISAVFKFEADQQNLARLSSVEQALTSVENRVVSFNRSVKNQGIGQVLSKDLGKADGALGKTGNNLKTLGRNLDQSQGDLRGLKREFAAVRAESRNIDFGDLKDGKQFAQATRQVHAYQESLKALERQVTGNSAAERQFKAQLTQAQRIAGDKVPNQVNQRKAFASADKAGIAGGVAAVGTAIALPAIGIGKTAITDLMGFNDQMAEVSAKSGATGEALKSLRMEAKKLGSETRFSASQAASGFVILSQAGQSAEQQLKTIGPVTQLAAASNVSLADSADVVLNTLGQYNLDVEKSGYVTDVLSNTAKNANVTLPELAETLKFAGKAAETTGISLDYTMAITRELSKGGLKGSQAGTAERAIFARLADKKIQGKLEGMGATITRGGEFVEAEEMLGSISAAMEKLPAAARKAKFGELFGMEASNAAMALFNQEAVKSINSFADIANEVGVTGRQAKIMEQDIGGAFRSMRSAIEGVSISIGETLKPMVLFVIHQITGLAQAFLHLPEPVQKFMIATGFAVVALAGIAAVVGAGALAFFTLQGAIASNALAMTVLRSGLVPLTGFFQAIMTSMGAGGFLGVLGSVQTAIVGLGSTIATFATMALGAAFSPIGLTISGLMLLYGALEYLTPGFNILGTVLGVVGGALGFVYGLVKGIAMGIAQALSPAVEGLGQMFAPVTAAFTSTFGFLGDAISQAVNWFQQGSSLGEAIGLGLVNAITGMFGIIPNFVGLLLSGVTSMIGGFATWLGNALSGIFGIVPNFVGGLLNSMAAMIGGFATWLGNAFLGLPTFITGPFLVLPAIAGAVLNGLKALWEGFAGWLSDRLMAIPNGVKDAFSKILPPFLRGEGEGGEGGAIAQATSPKPGGPAMSFEKMDMEAMAMAQLEKAFASSPSMPAANSIQPFIRQPAAASMAATSPVTASEPLASGLGMVPTLGIAPAIEQLKRQAPDLSFAAQSTGQQAVDALGTTFGQMNQEVEKGLGIDQFKGQLQGNLKQLQAQFDSLNFTRATAATEGYQTAFGATASSVKAGLTGMIMGTVALGIASLASLSPVTLVFIAIAGTILVATTNILGLRTMAQGVFQTLKALAQGVGQLIQGILQMGRGIIQMFEGVEAALRGDFSGIKAGAEQAFDGIKLAGTGVVTAVKGTFQGLQTFLRGIFEGIDQIARTLTGEIFRPLVSSAQQAQSRLQSIWSAFTERIQAARPFEPLKARLSGLSAGVSSTVERMQAVSRSGFAALDDIPVLKGAIASVQRVSQTTQTVIERIQAAWRSGTQAIDGIPLLSEAVRVVRLVGQAAQSVFERIQSAWRSTTDGLDAVPILGGAIATVRGLSNIVQSVLDRVTGAWRAGTEVLNAIPLLNGAGVDIRKLVGIFESVTEQIAAKWRAMSERLQATMGGVAQKAKGVGRKLVSFLADNSPGPTWEIPRKWKGAIAKIEGDLSGLAASAQVKGQKITGALTKGDLSGKFGKAQGALGTLGGIVSNFSPALAGPIFMLGDLLEGVELLGEHGPALAKKLGLPIGKFKALGSVGKKAFMAVAGGAMQFGGTIASTASVALPALWALVAPLAPFIAAAAAAAGAIALVVAAYRSNFLGIQSLVTGAIGMVASIPEVAGRAWGVLVSVVQAIFSPLDHLRGLLETIGKIAQTLANPFKAIRGLLPGQNVEAAATPPVSAIAGPTAGADSSGEVGAAGGPFSQLADGFLLAKERIALAWTGFGEWFGLKMGSMVGQGKEAGLGLIDALNHNPTVRIPWAWEKAGTRIWGVLSGLVGGAKQVGEHLVSFLGVAGSYAVKGLSSAFNGLTWSIAAMGLTSLPAFMPILLALAGVGLAIIAVKRNFLGMRDILRGVGLVGQAAFSVLWATLTGLVQMAQGVANIIGGVFTLNFSQIRLGASQVGAGLGRIADGIQHAWALAAKGMSMVFSGVFHAITRVSSFASNALKLDFNDLKTFVLSTAQSIANAVTAPMRAWESLRGILRGAKRESVSPAPSAEQLGAGTPKTAVPTANPLAPTPAGRTASNVPGTSGAVRPPSSQITQPNTPPLGQGTNVLDSFGSGRTGQVNAATEALSSLTSILSVLSPALAAPLGILLTLFSSIASLATVVPILGSGLAAMGIGGGAASAGLGATATTGAAATASLGGVTFASGTAAFSILSMAKSTGLAAVSFLKLAGTAISSMGGLVMAAVSAAASVLVSWASMAIGVIVSAGSMSAVVSTAFGAIAGAAGLAWSAVLAPILPIVGAIALVVAAVYGIYRGFKFVFGLIAKATAPVLDMMRNAWSQWVGGIRNIIGGIVDAYKQTFGQVVGQVRALIGIFLAPFQRMRELRGEAGGLGAAISSVINTVLGPLKVVGLILQAFIRFSGLIMQGVIMVAGAILTQLMKPLHAVVDSLKGIYTTARNAFRPIGDAFKPLLDLWQMLNDRMAAAGGTGGTMAARMGQGLRLAFLPLNMIMTTIGWVLRGIGYLIQGVILIGSVILKAVAVPLKIQFMVLNGIIQALIFIASLAWKAFVLPFQIGMRLGQAIRDVFIGIVEAIASPFRALFSLIDGIFQRLQNLPVIGRLLSLGNNQDQQTQQPKRQFASGGFVGGQGLGDIQNIWADSREFILNPMASKLNAPFLEGMNAGKSILEMIPTPPPILIPAPVSVGGSAGLGGSAQDIHINLNVENINVQGDASDPNQSAQMAMDILEQLLPHLRQPVIEILRNEVERAR